MAFNEVKIRGWLELLLAYSSIQLADLTGEQLKAFTNLKTYIDLLYETEVYYAKLYNIVQEVFAPITVVVAGTVGGYFRGCFLQAGSNVQKGCAVTCVGSMPPPRSDKSFEICEYGVINTVYDTRTKQYVFIKQKENKEGMYYLYLNAGYYVTDDQRNGLKKMGVCKVWVRGPGNVDYSAGFIELAAIPDSQPVDNTGGEALTAFIFLFLIILLVCLIK